MSNAHAIHEIITFSTELKTSPSAPAITDRADFAILGSKGASTGEYFRGTDFFGVARGETGEIEKLVNCGIGEGEGEFIFWENLSCKATGLLSMVQRGIVDPGTQGWEETYKSTT